MKIYHAKVLVWKDEEGKKKGHRIEVTAKANSKTNAHRVIIEQLWNWGYLVRWFITLETVSVK